jgi:hypothetical protein
MAGITAHHARTECSGYSGSTDIVRRQVLRHASPDISALAQVFALSDFKNVSVNHRTIFQVYLRTILYGNI